MGGGANGMSPWMGQQQKRAPAPPAVGSASKKGAADSGEFGRRPDGTNKGEGWLGRIPMKDGSNAVMTEQTIGVNVGGKDMDIPLIVPTLSQSEIDELASGGKPTDSMVRKAVEHAKKRLAEGKSPYKD